MLYNFGKRKALILLIMALIFMAPACPPKPPTPKIWITVCNDFPDMPAAEARIANEFCPATHPAQYIDKDEQRPTEICIKHTKPEPPIPQCDIPWPNKHAFIPWDGALLGFFCSKDLDGEFTKERCTTYANALAEDGIPMTRGFSHFYDEIPGVWESWKPVDPEYRDVLQSRIRLMAERKITSIISLEPYGAGGPAPDADIDWIIDSAKPFLPFVVFETANENGNTGLSTKLINQLKAHGIPNENILIYFEDSGAFADLLVNALEGKGLASLHGVGSMDTVNAPWPRGWSTSPGTLKLMEYGLTGSNDGEDGEKKAEGLFWPWMPTGPGQRSTAAQGHDVESWYLAHGRGWEFLSASGFQQHGPGQQRPDLLGAVELGREERKALRVAYDETIH
jgi:hypothetical protein